MERGHPKCLQMRTEGKGYHNSCFHTHLHYFFLCFCRMVSCFICRNLTLPSLKQVFVRNGYFPSVRSISVVIKQAFFTLNCFSESKLAKMVLIFIKQNLRYTLNYSATPYFEVILCSVAQRFV